jgi:outer membrane receptor protein involved in Fe transport
MTCEAALPAAGDIEFKRKCSLTLLGPNYKGSHTTASDNEPQTRQSAYALVDYRAELAPVNGQWSVSLVGRNLTDEQYNVFTSVIPLAPGGAFANVRTKGREVALEWHWEF